MIHLYVDTLFFSFFFFFFRTNNIPKNQNETETKIFFYIFLFFFMFKKQPNKQFSHDDVEKVDKSTWQAKRQHRIKNIKQTKSL